MPSMSQLNFPILLQKLSNTTHQSGHVSIKVDFVCHHINLDFGVTFNKMYNPLPKSQVQIKVHSPHLGMKRITNSKLRWISLYPRAVKKTLYPSVIWVPQQTNTTSKAQPIILASITIKLHPPISRSSPSNEDSFTLIATPRIVETVGNLFSLCKNNITRVSWMLKHSSNIVLFLQVHRCNMLPWKSKSNLWHELHGDHQ
jgi:hypothetical protein